MTNTDVVGAILDLVAEYTIFMLPVIGILSALSFIFTFLFAVTLGLGKRTFKG